MTADIEETLILFHFIKKLVKQWNLNPEQEEELHKIAQKVLDKE